MAAIIFNRLKITLFSPLFLTAFIILTTGVNTAWAAPVKDLLPNGIQINAEYKKGQGNQPAVLITHGFLQTHLTQPGFSLASNLASQGYTTLSPTISLGVNNRIQSLACEAVHSNTIEDDIAEIDFWIKWLNKKGHNNIVLVGFSSSGNSILMQPTLIANNPSVKQIIFTSLSTSLANPNEFNKYKHLINNKNGNQSKSIKKFTLGYCKNNYAATTKNYLSYAQYNQEKIVDIIRQITIPTSFIIGSSDTIMPKNWIKSINSNFSAHTIITIKNASHFFDESHEFEFADEIEKIISVNISK